MKKFASVAITAAILISGSGYVAATAMAPSAGVESAAGIKKKMVSSSQWRPQVSNYNSNVGGIGYKPRP